MCSSCGLVNTINFEKVGTMDACTAFLQSDIAGGYYFLVCVWFCVTGGFYYFEKTVDINED